jgi:chemotaxis protein CheD
MKSLIIGVSDCVVCAEPDAALVTYALGSCIAVSAYDPVRRAGALLHFMLPDSDLDRDKAQANPYMFADSGIRTLLKLVSQGGSNPRKCTWRVAGGAQVLDAGDSFQIGKRNYLAAKKILWKEGLLVAAEAVGGAVSRTVRLDLASGNFWIREGGGPEIMLTKSSHGGSLCLSAC